MLPSSLLRSCCQSEWLHSTKLSINRLKVERMRLLKMYSLLLYTRFRSVAVVGNTKLNRNLKSQIFPQCHHHCWQRRPCTNVVDVGNVWTLYTLLRKSNLTGQFYFIMQLEDSYAIWETTVVSWWRISHEYHFWFSSFHLYKICFLNVWYLLRMDSRIIVSRLSQFKVNWNQ